MDSAHEKSAAEQSAKTHDSCKNNIVIETKKLNVFMGKNKVVNNVSIRIPKNMITVIIGHSGCGKTTLLKSLNRLLDIRPDVRVEGEILVDGQNILEPDTDVPSIRKKMGLLLQTPTPLPMSIFDNVAYGLRIHGERDKKRTRAKVQRSLSDVGLWDEVKERLDSPASMLSIGQQQRLCLARAIAIKPEVLLCDEPTSSLDPIAAKRIEELLINLKKDYTVVLVTHTLRQAKRIADYAIFIYSGEVLEQGKADELFNNPQNQKTREYIQGKIG